MPCWHSVIQTLFFNISVGQFEIGLECGFVKRCFNVTRPAMFYASRVYYFQSSDILTL